MNESLSRIVADLFEKAKGGEELSPKIQNLRDEIKKIIDGKVTIFGKLRELVESFREIIPEEKQRYHAAIKALSTTSKLSQQEIVKAVNNQLEEMKILEKGLMPDLPSWRDELKVMEAKSQEMRGEIAKLREKIISLESEEKGILNGMAAREKQMALVEKAMKELFADIGAEITTIKKKVEEFTAESAAAQPILPGDSMKNDIPIEKKGGGDQKSEIGESSAPQDTEWEKKCPMCGGRMNFHSNEKMWQCYSCAYEELQKDEVQDKSELAESSAPQDTKSEKKCPMCGGQMNYLSNEEMWQCYSCAYEELQKDKVPGKSEEKSEETNAPKPTSTFDPFPTLAAPLAPLFPDEFPKSKKGSSASDNQPSGKKKTCPVCRKKMDWYQVENTWRCPFCDYERSI